ncbi:uroporphyrinogen decarboxylase family protein, partial [Microbacterium sp. NRRL B-14842]|uniref:uroporphyrinogen decarboxylase family protein n=1 Tax=Microbacterium sp. NRRL B-14842 TaxID=3162881 RepID=UPI003D2A83A6
MGVDWRLPLDEAAAILGPDVSVQGNIDPAFLGAPWPVLEAHVRDVLERVARPAGTSSTSAMVCPGDRPRPAHPYRRAGARRLTSV